MITSILQRNMKCNKGGQDTLICDMRWDEIGPFSPTALCQVHVLKALWTALYSTNHIIVLHECECLLVLTVKLFTP